MKDFFDSMLTVRRTFKIVFILFVLSSICRLISAVLKHDFN